jgi:hypothetical protein
MKYLSIKNWEKFQHYKDRSPPWIKLHRELLDDYEFSCLQDASKAHLMLLWLLASQLDNKIPNDQRWLKNRLGLTVNIDVKELMQKGFLVCYQDASSALAECSLETEAETEADIIKGAGEKKQKTGVEELSTDHVAEWLAKKRAQGKYLDIDEDRQLEKFKDYCRAKNPKYSDYVAAFRNSFDWREAAKHENTRTNHTGSNGKSRRVKEVIAEALRESHGPGIFESVGGRGFEDGGLLPDLRERPGRDEGDIQSL